MMRISTPLFSLLLAASPALASDGLPSFSFTGAAALRVAAAEAPPEPALEARAADVVSRPHLLARAGRDVILGHAETAELAAEAAAEWSATLRAAGVTPGALRYESGVWILPYTSADGRVLRDFTADARQFPPKDDAGLRANKALTEQALTAAGLTLVSSKVLNLEFLLPTYAMMYLTAPNADANKEVRLRLLSARGESEFDVFAPHVTVVQVPRPYLMVYVGPQAGVVHMGAVDQAAADRRLAERRAFLTGQGKTIVAERVTPLEDPTVRFAVSLYFLY